MTDVDLFTDSSPFDSIRRVRPDGSEYWLARELHPLVGYERWERFVMAIERAQAAAENCGEAVQDHFRPSSKKVDLGSGAERWVADFELTRYAAYMSVMNGDPRKPEIAAAQSYFAIRTRQAEVIEQRLSVEDRAMKRLAVLRAAKGLIDDRHLEAKARCQLAIGLGEAPELEPSCRPLYAQTYLEERGLSRRQIKAIGSMFGKRLKQAFVAQHGVPPKQYPLETGSGQIRNVNAYTESDRALMDAVFERYYAGGGVVKRYLYRVEPITELPPDLRTGRLVYMSQSAAQYRASYLRERGVAVTIERSNEITWPDEAPATTVINNSLPSVTIGDELRHARIQALAIATHVARDRGQINGEHPGADAILKTAGEFADFIWGGAK